MIKRSNRLHQKYSTYFYNRIMCFFGAMFCFFGFLIIHIALFIYLPWSLPIKTLCLLGLGLIYFFVPLFFVLRFSSQRIWMKIFEADKLINTLKIDKN